MRKDPVEHKKFYQPIKNSFKNEQQDGSVFSDDNPFQTAIENEPTNSEKLVKIESRRSLKKRRSRRTLKPSSSANEDTGADDHFFGPTRKRRVRRNKRNRSKRRNTDSEYDSVASVAAAAAAAGGGGIEATPRFYQLRNPGIKSLIIKVINTVFRNLKLVSYLTLLILTLSLREMRKGTEYCPQEGSLEKGWFSCWPCPSHGVCDHGDLLYCEAGYLSQPNWLSWLWPLPDRCVPDTARKRRIYILAQGMQRLLDKRAGDVSCGYSSDDDNDPAMSIEQLESELLSVHNNSIYDQVWEEAVEDLIKQARVSVIKPGFLVSLQPEKSYSCQLLQGLTYYLSTFCWEISGIISLLLGFWYLKKYLKERREDDQRVVQLAEYMLQHLQEVDRMHQSDPLNNPERSVSITQCRDWLLRNETDLRKRQELWKRVQRIVETNTNVRTLEMELRGEPCRTWAWIGGIYAPQMVQISPNNRLTTPLSSGESGQTNKHTVF